MEIGSEAPTPEIVRSNDELCRFLLPDSANARRLSGNDLAWEVGIVGVQANRHPVPWLQAQIREKVTSKAESDADKYHLNNADRKALQELYIGFSQSMLYRDGQEFSVRIVEGPTTEWLADEAFPPDNLHVKGMEYLGFKNPQSYDLAHRNAKDHESVVEQQATLQAVRVSHDLLSALLVEFGHVAQIEGENRQVRKSKTSTFSYTALQTQSGSESERHEIFAVPTHRIGQMKRF